MCNHFWICAKMAAKYEDFFVSNICSVIYDATLEGPEIVDNSCRHHFQLLMFRNIVDALLFSWDIWSGVLHHITGEHEWALGACHQAPCRTTETRNR